MKSTLFAETSTAVYPHELNGSGAEALFPEDRGMRPVSLDSTERYARRTREAAEFLGDLVHGVKMTTMVNKYGRASLNEALTTSDFPSLFGNVLYRRLLAQYKTQPQTWRNYVEIDNTVQDFRDRWAVTIDGAASAYDPVKEQSGYPEAKLSDNKYLYHVNKFGRKLSLSWEMTVNDDLRAFQRAPQLMGMGGARSIERFVTQLYVDANGPAATFYTSGNKNIINTANGASVNNPPLNVQGIIDGLVVLSNMRDSDGEPILIDAIHLVVPPALWSMANNLTKANELVVGGFGQTAGGGTAGQQLRVENWIRNQFQVSVNYYIPVVANSANGNTSWFLFADPKTSGRPALEIGFLRGMEEPQMLMKAAQQQLIGGAPQPEFGDFETDSISYKARLVYGGTQVDGKMTVASNGSST